MAPERAATFAALGDLVIRSGYAGTWIYGILERALIPFGLHHVFYMPFWVMQRRHSQAHNDAAKDAHLQGGDTQGGRCGIGCHEATRFMAGKFPFMIFGLPGAALAMYKTAKGVFRSILEIMK